MFDSEDSLVRIDMSEYMEKFTVSRLIGAPPGYVGYEEGGQLTEKVRRKPYSVILLDEIEKALKRTFSPEFLNRIDDVVIFNSLTKEHIFEIIDILMKGVMKRLNNMGFTLQITKEAKEFIAEKGYDVQFGARPLHRAIQKHLEDVLAEEILSINVKQGDILIADLDKDNKKIKFEFSKKQEEASV